MKTAFAVSDMAESKAPFSGHLKIKITDREKN
jgi:hypothetical protein